MMDAIFQALETRLKDHTKFSGFDFFRFDTQANSNQQSNASAPFLKLAIRQEQSQQQNTNRWRLQNQITFDLEIRWKTDHNNINDFERIQEKADHIKAAKQAIFPREDEEDYLELPYITNLMITSRPVEFGGIEVKKQNGVTIEITIEYAEAIK